MLLLTYVCFGENHRSRRRILPWRCRRGHAALRSRKPSVRFAAAMDVSSGSTSIVSCAWCRCISPVIRVRHFCFACISDRSLSPSVSMQARCSNFFATERIGLNAEASGYAPTCSRRARRTGVTSGSPYAGARLRLHRRSLWRMESSRFRLVVRQTCSSISLRRCRPRRAVGQRVVMPPTPSLRYRQALRFH